MHCIALHCIALHCIALHCIALHCIVLINFFVVRAHMTYLTEMTSVSDGRPNYRWSLFIQLWAIIIMSGSVSHSFELVYIALMLASLFFYWHVDDSIPNFRWRLFIWLMSILIMKIVLYVWYWLLEIEVMVIYILRRQKVINQFQGKKALQLLDGSHWG